MALAIDALGRVITYSVTIKLTPPKTRYPGDMAPAQAIGEHLVQGLHTELQQLRIAAEAEGFVVHIGDRQVVY